MSALVYTQTVFAAVHPNELVWFLQDSYWQVNGDHYSSIIQLTLMWYSLQSLKFDNDLFLKLLVWIVVEVSICPVLLESSDTTM